MEWPSLMVVLGVLWDRSDGFRDAVKVPEEVPTEEIESMGLPQSSRMGCKGILRKVLYHVEMKKTRSCIVLTVSE